MTSDDNRAKKQGVITFSYIEREKEIKETNYYYLLTYCHQLSSLLYHYYSCVLSPVKEILMTVMPAPSRRRLYVHEPEVKSPELCATRGVGE
jgi:hypothetical protein